MESKKSNEIKTNFAKYAGEKDFKYFNSDPIIAPQDSKLLFNISGGVRYQEELLELKVADESNVASIQKCVRTDSIDSVGFSGRHHLFFEMLGHFMFYNKNEKECKEDFIRFAYQFLTDIVGLDKKRLYATVNPSDEVSINIWKELGNNNLIMSDKNIFISPYADKSALRTEILWQRDDTEKSLVELWNLVFTQFNSKNVFENYSQKIGADSGASLERIVTASENKNNNYENSMWFDFVNDISSLNGKVGVEYVRRIADLSNTSANLINEGLIPGNKVQPYMLRKMLRVLFDHCDDYGINIETLFETYLAYNKISIDKSTLVNVVLDEQEKYLKSIVNGLKQAKKEITKKGISNIDPEYLKSTCGLSEKYIADLLNVENGPRLIKK